MLFGKGQSFEVDWWSLGIITYELLVGHTPFLCSTNEMISDRQHRTRIKKQQPFLNKLQRVGKKITHVSDFVQKLLVKEPAERLGNVFGDFC